MKLSKAKANSSGLEHAVSDLLQLFLAKDFDGTELRGLTVAVEEESSDGMTRSVEKRADREGQIAAIQYSTELILNNYKEISLCRWWLKFLLVRSRLV